MRTGRIDNLTSLRFFAALSIFLHHSIPLGVDFSQYARGLNFGWTVSFFYVLSGFVLSYSRDGRIHNRKDIAMFIGERVFRLWPLHLVCGLFVMLTLTAQGSFEQYYLFLTMQHSWVSQYYTAFFLNGASWSISVEWYFYLMFPFIILLNVRSLVALTAAWIIIVTALMIAVSWYPRFFPFSPPTANLMQPGVTVASFFHLFPPVRFAEFLIGMLTYHAYRRFPLSSRMATLVQIAALGLAALYVFNVPWVSKRVYSTLPVVIAQTHTNSGLYPIFACIVFAFAYQTGPLSRALSSRVLIYLGEISFSLYMVHQIVISIIAQQTDWALSWGSGVAVLVALAISLVASSALYEGLEKPSLRWGKRLLRGASSRDHASEGQSGRLTNPQVT